MKLQINSLAALERLIGGDTEVEIEIRNNIVQEFSKKHLKALVNEGTIKTVADQINSALRAHAEQVISDKFGVLGGDYWRRKLTLTAECKKALSDAATEVYHEKIREALKKAGDYYSTEYITKEINRVVDREVQKRIDAGVQARLDEIKRSI